jgi:predicted SAM-dependent methyltransferase
LPERSAARRLNWGCGSHVAPGWINTDVKDGAGVDLVADIRRGLPLATASMDYAVSIHALPELAYAEQVPALEELRRVLKPDGVLRLGLPDLSKGIDAYLSGDESYFEVDEDAARTPGGRFIVHMLWYGYSRTLFTADFVGELLERAGFVNVRECAFGATASRFEEITSLDNRRRESLFVEADRGAAEPRRWRRSYTAAMAQGPSVQVVELVHETPNDLVRGNFRVEDSDEGLKLVGWALGFDSPVTQVEVAVGDEVVARAPIVVERPDIAEAFPDVAGAETAGFQLVIQPSGRGRSRLQIQAALDDGERAPFGALDVIAAPRRRRGLFRRGR